MAKFIYYNPNPLEKRTGDCVIRALTKLLYMDWDTVFVDLFTKSFAMKDMMDHNIVWNDYLESMGYIRKSIPDRCPLCYSIADAEGKMDGWGDGMSHRSYRDSYIDDYSGLRMRSPMTGRYISTRDNYRDGNMSYRDDSYRDGYTNHSKDDLIMDLEMKARNAQTERERNSIMETIDIIKRQKMS